MKDDQTEELREQVFNICRKLSNLIPPVNLHSEKADETLRFWLPDMSEKDRERFKQEYLASRVHSGYSEQGKGE
jgi:hypothetical protein